MSVCWAAIAERRLYDHAREFATETGDEVVAVGHPLAPDRRVIPVLLRRRRINVDVRRPHSNPPFEVGHQSGCQIEIPWAGSLDLVGPNWPPRSPIGEDFES